MARTSATVVTITLPAFASYNITADETITVTAATVKYIGLSSVKTLSELPQTRGAILVPSGNSIPIPLRSFTYSGSTNTGRRRPL